MQTNLTVELADSYKSNSQIARVLTEAWVNSEVFCPSCGSVISRYNHNNPAADFYCEKCCEQFELKSKKNSLGNKVVDGAYATLINKLSSNDNPNLFLLSYNAHSVIDFCVVPKHFFVPEIVEKRRPLSDSARRAGWVGCNIVLGGIPEAGKIYYIRNAVVFSKNSVKSQWGRTAFLREQSSMNEKGWIMDIMKCIDILGKTEFTLGELYEFEENLKVKHPKNKHIKAKIRQQLQLLRDNNYLVFTGKGKYMVTKDE